MEPGRGVTVMGYSRRNRRLAAGLGRNSSRPSINNFAVAMPSALPPTRDRVSRASTYFFLSFGSKYSDSGTCRTEYGRPVLSCTCEERNAKALRSHCRKVMPLI